TFPWTRNHDNMGVKWDDHPNLKRWFEAISARPAVKKALEIVGGIKSNRETASQDDKDRFFNRGKDARAWRASSLRSRSGRACAAWRGRRTRFRRARSR